MIIVRSIDRTSGSSSNCVIPLSCPIEGRYQVVACLMPFTFYTVKTGINDKIYFYDSASAASLTGTVAEGVYDTGTISAALKTAMDAVSSTTYTVTFSSLTKKLTFTPAAGTMYFEWSNDNNDSAHRLLGFEKQDGSAAASQSSDNVVDLNLTHVVHFQIDEAASSVSTSGAKQNLSVLAFPITEASTWGSFVMHDTSEYSQSIDLPHSTNQLTVKLRDQLNRTLTLNGEWQLFLKEF